MSTRASPRHLAPSLKAGLESHLGPLELLVLESLWKRSGEACVRDLSSEFRGTAYTTLMTTLDRLHKKGILERRKAGRAFYYRPRLCRAALHSALTANAIDAILGPPAERSSVRPVLSCFVEAVSQRDQILLDELERLVREKRRELEKTHK